MSGQSHHQQEQPRVIALAAVKPKPMPLEWAFAATLALMALMHFL